MSVIVGGMSLLLLRVLVVPAGAQQEVIDAGKIEYQRSCAVCHGLDGKGDGRMAKLLKVKPANLTQLSAKYYGIFQFWDLYRIIDGRKEVGGHGSREMPIWGTVFKHESGTDRGADLTAHARILEIVYYIESIQTSPRPNQ
jgi:hypothetical protein